MTNSAASEPLDLFDEWSHFCATASSAKDGELQFGVGVPEKDARYIGDVSGKRVLVIGADPWNNAVTLAQRGATVVVIEPSVDALDATRNAAAAQGLRIDARIAEFADLAFTLADTVDLAVSAWALAFTPDLGRIFRQVHRVLKPSSSFVFGVPHPAAALFETSSTTEDFSQHVAGAAHRTWFDDSAVRFGVGTSAVRHRRITFGELYPEIVRAGFRLDAYAEPEPDASNQLPMLVGTQLPLVPASAVFRVRKETA